VEPWGRAVESVGLAVRRGISTSSTHGSNEEWRALAREDQVLRNVLAWPDREGWSEQEFYATGEADWEDFRRHWRHYQPELGGTCLEIGCGAGRITRALARDFDRVVALDVSSDMLEHARGAASEHVELRLVDEPAIPLAGGEADAVFSVHVLQHLDRFQAIRDYLAEARRVLRPGGSLMVHIPVLGKRPPMWRLARAELEIRLSRRRQRKGGLHSHVRMRFYPPEQVHGALRDLGFREVELRMFPVRSNGYHHQFWLATAP
jgi:ubiquinone/menaquinone biosynthesis C-methylase UbiE